MKKNRWIGWTLLGLAGLAISAGWFSCKEFGIPEYPVTVVFEEGIEGTPAAGVHYYPDLTTVEYAYTATDSSHSVEVLIEETNWMPSGFFTVYGSLEILVKRFDVRGSWSVTLTSEGGGETLATYNMTFYGPDMLGGTVLDDRGYTGPWEKDGDKIEIFFDNWEEYYFVCGSLVTSTRELTLEGTWFNGEETGWWSATRN